MNNMKNQHFHTSIKILFILLFAGIAAILPNNSYSQNDSITLTLEDALHLAHQQSPDALIAKNTFLKNYWAYRSYKADYLPSVTLDATLPSLSQSYRIIPVENGPDIFQFNDFNNYSAKMTINQKIGPTGGSVFLQSSLQRLDNFLPDTSYTSYQTTPVIIGYSQPLFQFNQYKWDKKLEPLRYEKAKRKYLEDMEQISITTTQHFFNLLVAQVQKDISVKNMKNYDTLYRIAKGRFNLGKIAENDLLQLELNYLKAKAAVDKDNLNYENMVFRLKSYLRIKETQPVNLIPPAETKYKVINADEAIQQAKKNTSSALDFDERLISAESQLSQAKLNGRFDADLYLEYGLTQSADQLADSYKDPRNQQMLNLGIKMPLLDWGRARGNINVAESNLELEKTAVEQDVIDFQQNVFLQVMQFNMQKEQLIIAAKSDTVAQKRFEITQKRYMIGLINDVLELNNAQIDNDNAKQGYYQSLRSYWLNYFELRQMTLYDFFDDRMLIFDIRDIMSR
jgi:outer membrane protein